MHLEYFVVVVIVVVVGSLIKLRQTRSLA